MKKKNAAPSIDSRRLMFLYSLAEFFLEPLLNGPRTIFPQAPLERENCSIVIVVRVSVLFSPSLDFDFLLCTFFGWQQIPERPLLLTKVNTLLEGGGCGSKA